MEPSEAKRARVLVVDDDESFRKSLKNSLVGFGYEVNLAESVSAAEEFLQKEGVEAVVTNVRMPDGNGLELVSHVRKKFPNTTIVVMTGNAEVKSEKEALNQGADGFLEKPFKTEDLVQILKDSMNGVALESFDAKVFYPASES